jgi:hypothetical protein
MPKNLSVNYGLPASYGSALEQHKILVQRLRENKVFTFAFQNRGYLALKKRQVSDIVYYENILTTTKPVDKKILLVTRV